MVGEQTGRGAIGIAMRMLSALVLSSLGSRKFVTLLAKPRGNDLALLSELMSAEKVSSVVDRCFGLSEIPDAIQYLETERARGKIVVSIL